MFYYLLYNSSFSFIIDNRLFSTILYGSILYVLTHAILNYCNIEILTIINNYFWIIFTLDIISLSYGIYQVYLDPTQSIYSGNTENNNSNHNTNTNNNLSVSFNLLKNKINTLLDRKNDLTITQINTSPTNTNSLQSPQQQQQRQSNQQPRQSNQQPRQTTNKFSTPISQLQKQQQQNNTNIEMDNMDYNDNDYTDYTDYTDDTNDYNGNNGNNGNNISSNNNSLNNNSLNNNGKSASTPINIIRKKQNNPPEPIINEDGYAESVAGSDLGSVMDLDDFEKSL